MATLYLKKPDGIWYINYTIDGRRYKKSTRTKDKKLAQIMYDDLKVKLFKEEMGVKTAAKNKIRIVDFLRRYIDFRLNSSPFDKHSEISRLRIISEFFARKAVRHLQEISPVLIDEFLTTTLAGHKPSTKQNYFNLIKRMLNRAVGWELIEFNPIAKMKAPKVPKSFSYFNKDEVKSLIENAEEPLKTGIIMLAYTGMRSGELLHLRYRDVDLNAGNIRIWPYSEFTPKGKRPRTIPISPELRPLLKRLLKGKKSNEFVYHPFEHPLRLTKRFGQLIKKLGFRGSLHDLRHTFASHLAMAGVPIMTIKELLGHSNIGTTNIYTHFIPNQNQDEIQKLKFT